MAKFKIELDERDLREAVDEWCKKRYGAGMQDRDEISLYCSRDDDRGDIFSASTYVEQLKA